jgi:hypothetical protein
VKTVFLDTVGLVALCDQWHADAMAAYQAIPTNVYFFTTTFVLLECGNTAARKPYRQNVDGTNSKRTPD